MFYKKEPRNCVVLYIICYIKIAVATKIFANLDEELVLCLDHLQ